MLSVDPMSVWKIRSLALVVVCVALPSCGAGRSTAGPPAVMVHVTERDFHIGTSAQRVHAGAVDLSVHNQGPDDHELVVVPEHPGTPLPMRADGVTLNEERLLPVTIQPHLEPGRPGSTRELRLHLTPGRYVLFCNMAGHYLSGMHTQLVVSR
jgi:uncharacterized cupredoxin-like copper-binding protein